MKKDRRGKVPHEGLRREAEERLSRGRGAGTDAPGAGDDRDRLVHELQVYQIELEMQNEELIRSRTEIEAGLQRFADLYDFAPAGYVTLTPDGRMVQANLAAARLLGTERALLANRRFESFVAEADRSAFGAFLARAFGSDAKESCEVALGHRQDRPIPGSLDPKQGPVSDDRTVRIEAAVSDDRTTCRAIVTDVTERKRLEQALTRANAELEDRVRQRTEELERRSRQLRALSWELTRTEARERERLARILHDDLQQLLVGAKLTLLPVRASLTNQAVVENLDQVKGLLDQAIAGCRTLVYDLSPPIVHDGTLPDTLRWLTRWVQKHHALAVDLQVDEEIEAGADARVLLFHAARELLLNVVKHAGVNRAGIRLAHPGPGLLELTVTDEGKGFDPGVVGRSAEPWTGFGLFSLRERLDWISGRLEVVSGPGRGTRATVYVPHVSEPVAIIAPAGARRAPAPRRVEPTGTAAPVRVLIADDHRILREGLVRLLREAADLEIVGEAEDGRQAVEMTRRLHPDVVLMDVGMPHLSGIEATRIITAESPQCRVVVLSIHPPLDMEESALDAGAAAYLVKDGPTEALLSAIRGVPDPTLS